MKNREITPDFIAQVTYKTSEEGGRKTPASSGYRPQVKFPFSKDMTSGTQRFIDKEIVYPGEKVKVEITMLSPQLFENQLEIGMDFELREGATIVATGIILDILNGKLVKEATLLEKLESIGIDDFKYCICQYDVGFIPRWNDEEENIIIVVIRENEKGFHELEVFFTDLHEEETLGEKVFEMNFLDKKIDASAIVNKSICDELMPDQDFKFSKKKNGYLIEDFHIASKLFFRIVDLIIDKKPSFKLDSTPIQEDPVYTEIKKVLRGELMIDTLKKELIYWIHNRFKIEVLHIVYDTIHDGELYRINVIVKTRDEVESMRSSDFNYKKSYQEEIENAYVNIYGKESVMNTGLYRRLFVCYTSFHDLHVQYNTQFITSEEVREIINHFSDIEIWNILDFHGGIFVCLYTQEQVKNLDADTIEKLKKHIYSVEKKYDEFDKLTEENFSINFISKETIDNDYNGHFINLFR